MSPDFRHLHSNSIFPVRINDGWFVYVPLSDSCFMADVQDLIQIEHLLSNNELIGSQYYDFLSPMIDDAKAHKFLETSPRSLTNISIFPTWACNFNCSYCYASQAHTKGNIPVEIAISALDYFFSLGTDPIALQLLGGGEPFTQWDIVKQISKYARRCEKLTGRKLTISIATNGSLLSDEIINDILDYDIRLSFSFDVIREIQEKQRGKYDIVCRNLKKLLDAGLGDKIFLRTVITPYSASFLEDIVQEVIREFSDVCGVIAEPVMGSDNFESEAAYQQFCKTFYHNFSSARTKALRQGLNFTTMSLRNVDFSIDRGCEGDFCVTPDGSISICHRLALPSTMENIENNFCYGVVRNGHVSIDSERYHSLLGPTVNEYKECKNCFAKYNCGGGCIARNINETTNSKKLFCELTKNLLIDELVRRFNLANYDTFT